MIENLIESMNTTPHEYKANLGWISCTDGVPDDARPVFVRNKDSWKSPGKIAHFDKELGWVKIVDRNCKVKIRCPRFWMEILTPEAHSLFESEVLKKGEKPIRESEFRMDYGDAFYDTMYEIEKAKSLPKKTKQDEFEGDTLVMTFKSPADAKKYGDAVKAHFEEIKKNSDPEDPDMNDEIISKIIDISDEGNILRVSFDKSALMSEDEDLEEAEKKEADKKEVVESLINKLF